MASAKSALTAAASLAASAMLVRSVAKDLIPVELESYLFSSFYGLLSRFSPQFTITIEEFDGFAINQIYAAAEIYLGSISSGTTTTKRLRVSKPVKDKNILVVADEGQDIVDYFEGMELRWTPCLRRETESMTAHYSDDYESSYMLYARYFILRFHKKHQQKVLHSYLPHVLSLYKSMKEAQKGVKLYTIRYDNFRGGNQNPWTSINLDHPSTFQTLAMDPELKGEIKADLDRFLERKDYYRKVGKAWKRGYLLYGPPGTGKSSLIAAMANYLNFSIYDLELPDLQSNSELRKLLVATANRSILVVEDIDCSVDFNDRPEAEEQPVVIRRGRMVRPHPEKKVTLSGLLNFIDGLWSSCGDERIIIFTTNHKEKLDPALIRPGRMDMHIHMSYCKFNAFKVLAANYLSIQDHKRFPEIEVLMEEADVTPAEVAEELMKSDNSDFALEGLVKFLHEKKMVAIQEKERAEKEIGEGEVEGKDDNAKKDKDIEGVNGKHEELLGVVI